MPLFRLQQVAQIKTEQPPRSGIMEGLKVSGSPANLQMPPAAKIRAAEGSAGEEVRESQAAKTAEAQKGAELKAPPKSASPEGVGTLLDLQG
jgi:hypothetical protein